MDRFNSPLFRAAGKDWDRCKAQQHELTGINMEGENTIFTEVSKFADSLCTSEGTQI